MMRKPYVKPAIVREFVQPTMACPRCGHEQADFDGFGVVYCAPCGYCRHLSRDDGRCNYCGQPDTRVL